MVKKVLHTHPKDDTPTALKGLVRNEDIVDDTGAFNKPFITPLPQIHIHSAKDPSLTGNFMSALENTGAQVIPVASMEELAVIFYKSGGGMEDIINTIPEIGAVNADEIRRKNDPGLSSVYQIWVRGALGVAENGEIWLEGSAMVNRLRPFTCEHLVIVLDAIRLVADLSEAHTQIEMNREAYGVFIAGSSKTGDRERSLIAGAHGARKVAVCLIDKEFNKAPIPVHCGPGCNC